MNVVRYAEMIAKRHHDGHLTIMRFTSGWKAVFDTPRFFEGNDYDVVWGLRTAASIEEACADLLRRSGHVVRWRIDHETWQVELSALDLLRRDTRQKGTPL